MSDTPPLKQDSPSWLPWVILLLIAVTGLRTISHPDYWTHLLQAQGPLNGTDTIVFASHPETSPNATWLYDRLLGTLHHMGGEATSTLFHVACVTAAFGLLIPVLLRIAGSGATSLGLVLSCWLLISRFEPRASLLAVLPAAVFIRVLQSSKSLVLRLAILVPVQLLWTNLHWSFFLGPLMVLGYVLGDFLEARNAPREEQTGSLVPVEGLIVFGATAASTLLNPWLFGLHSQTVSLHTNLKDSVWAFYGAPAVDVLQNMIMYPYWSQYGNGPGGPIAICLGLGALGLVLFRGKLPWGLTGVAVLSALFVVQQYAIYREIFAIGALPFLAISIHSIGTFLRDKTKRSTLIVNGTTGLSLLGGVLLAGSVVNNSMFLRHGNGSSFGLGIAKNVLPTGLIDVLQDERAPRRILTTPIPGSFIAAQLGHDRVSIDSRITLHAPSSYTTVYKTLVTPSEEESQKHLAAWNPDAILLDLQDPAYDQLIHRLLQSGWRPVYLDGLVLLLVDQPEVYAAPASEWMKQGLAELEAASDAARASAGFPFYAPLPVRCLGGARGLLSLGAAKQADELLDVVENGMPVVRGLALTRGIAKLAVADDDKAIFYLEIAVKQRPDHPYTLGFLATAYERANRKPEADAIKVRLKNMNKPPTSETGNEG